MADALKEAANEAGALIGSVGTYARIVLLGVWFPGFLVFCEVASVFFHCLQLPGGPIGYIAEAMKPANTVIASILIGIIVLATSIALGYVMRDIAFALSDLWLHRGWPPSRGLARIFRQIRFVYGRDKVDEVGRSYHVFKLAYGELDTSNLPRQDDSYVREFCKEWLKLNLPNLNTEGLEIEINMVIGLILPIALASMVFIAYLAWPLASLFTAMSLAAAIFMMYRIIRARDIETEQAIVNFLFVHWEKESPQQIPPPGL